ncbi:hypothetical protein ACE193_12675 [Bernardetia sp. OM2101]|uniref:hypothetical protein n=1 Tax=Bernardetia sp. OM2101 TaxID=3344876 RepID=UPI0035CEC854
MQKFISTSIIGSFLLLLFFSFSTNTATAQTTLYNWDSYGVQFSIPNTHEIKQSSGTAFESGDNLTWLEMYPFKDYSATSKGMVQEIMNQKGYRAISEGTYESGGYDGYWVRCSTAKHPTWLFWVIGFIDPESDTNFYAIIWWKKDNQRAYDLAYNMSYSFKRMK